MTTPRWTRTIHTDAFAPWLSPSAPKPGDEVTIVVRVAKDAPVASIYLRLILDGIDHHVAAKWRRNGERFAWYEARFVLDQPTTHFHLLVRTTGGEVYYVNRAGARSVFPTEEHDFTIDTIHRAPDWVASSVFYQIFPDRFHRGDEHLGVADGEIRRGEFTSRSMPWESTPLPYKEGGSLDFFNGDLPGIEAKLDYLADLGVNALYLTPIFTAKTNHRYDCLDYFSVDPHVGGDDALASLLRAAHARQIRVMLDVSINHIGVEHKWATGLPTDHGPVEVVAKRDDGSVVNWAGVPELLKLDYTVPELRNRVYKDYDSVVQRYLREPFVIDAWRFDVASETGNLGVHQEGHDLWREVRSVVKGIDAQTYVVGEHWQDSVAYLQGDQWDSAMNYFASGRLMRMWMGELDRFATVPVTEARPGRPISGEELGLLLDQHFSRIPSGVLHAQFNLLDSHDVTRLHNNNAVFDWEIYQGVIMLGFLLPGTFSIYYGDEVGLPGTLDEDHGKRFPMEWHQDKWDRRFTSLYRAMIALKRGSEVLHHGSYRVLDVGEDHLVFARFTDTRALLLLLNRTPAEREFQIDGTPLGLRTAKAVEPGEVVPLHVEDGTVRMRLGANQSALLRCELSD